MKTRGIAASGRCVGIGSGRRGVATVEMAVLMPLLLMLIFGTLEIGLMAKQSHSLNHVARETARVAAVGATNSEIQAHMTSTAPGLDTSLLTSTIEYRAWDETTATWGSWATLTDDGVENVAVSGDQIRVQLTYSYELATGGMLAETLNAGDGNAISLTATIISMRE